MPEVDARSQGVFVNAAGLLYASIGFSLSVLAALINLLHPPKAQDGAPAVPSRTRVTPSPSPRGRRKIRSVSDKYPKSLKTPKPEPEPRTLSPERHDESIRPKEPSSEKRIISSRHVHRRSKSMANIPIITIDYFGSTDTLNARRSAEFLKPAPRILEPVAEPPKPLPLPTDFPSAPAFFKCNSIAANCGDGQPAHNFRLFGLKPWSKERTKELERRKSSPQLCRSASLPRPSSCHKQSNSEGVLTNLTKNETKTKSRKSLRKLPTVPAQSKEKIGIKFEVSFRHAEKKRSQTPRTQPYDAPYFALPPVSPLAAYIAPTQEEPFIPPSHSHPEPNSYTKPLDGKPSKSRI